MAQQHLLDRLGRKTYPVDIANGENRAVILAVSYTVIGVRMLVGGLIGLIGDWLGATATVLLLGLSSLLASFLIHGLPEVSEPG